MLAAVVGWQQGQSLPMPSKTLTMDGLSVGIKAGATGNGYGVPIDSVRVFEAGPGRVSTMAFTIEDPAGEVSVAADQFVRFHDTVLDKPIFAGWVESVSVQAMGIGRSISVTCVGMEILLDWVQVPSITAAVGADIAATVQALISQATGTGLAMMNTAVTSLGLSANPDPVTSDAGSLRQALKQLYGKNFATVYSMPETSLSFVVTFDGYLVWVLDQNPSTPTRDNAMGPSGPITLSSAGPVRPSGTSYQVDGTAPAGVVVTGTGGVSVVMSGRSSGRVDALSDTTLATDAQRRAAGLAYLNANNISTTGRVSAEGTVSISSGIGQRAWNCKLVLTDTQVGMNSTAYITGITKTFTPGQETWDIEFGRSSASTAAEYLRVLTRTQNV